MKIKCLVNVPLQRPEGQLIDALCGHCNSRSPLTCNFVRPRTSANPASRSFFSRGLTTPSPEVLVCDAGVAARQAGREEHHVDHLGLRVPPFGGGAGGEVERATL